MHVVDRTFSSPEENLAFDDSLLGTGWETLRFWESPVPFVVLGRSGRAEEEVDRAACEWPAIPVLRRSSGGGTVLQGPGCLNFALVLSLEHRPELANVPDSYRVILSRVANGLRVRGLEVRGSDILYGGKKVSGNAQRRTRGWLLHHGTLLYRLDAGLMERVLLEPRRQPPHRAGRPHREFVTILPMSVGELKRRVVSAWSESIQAAFSPGAEGDLRSGGTNPATSISSAL
jgi:lipoate-protein ligase A